MKAPWRDFVWSEEVALVAYDPQVTEILSGLGPGGPAAMPAQLPAASGYTYAVELSADEAVTAGAVRVEFNHPVYHYVENFLGFPVGGDVPVGYYDRQEARWIASNDGRVIEILGVDGGQAQVDLDGGGTPATPEELAALGFSDGELARLAELYGPGESLWRTPIPHFTPWDCNWPYGPPDDAEDPPDPDKDEPDEDDPEEPDDPDEDPNDDPEEDEDEPCEEGGSTIECENQVLGESVEIAGTPYRLNYRSSRVPGRRVANLLEVRLSNRKVPASLKRIEMAIYVAGQRHRRSFSPAPGLVHRHLWDGLDAYGRTVRGRTVATVWVGYVYPARYYEPAVFAASFGRFSSSTRIIGNRSRGEVTLWRQSRKPVGQWDSRGLGLGGWSFDPQHVYDPNSATLFLGTGQQRSGSNIAAGRVVSRRFPYSDAGVVAAGPDGSVYVVESLYSIDRIWRFTGDGLPRAVHTTKFSGWKRIRDVAVAEDGTVYYTTTGCSRSSPGYVRKVEPGDRYWDDAETLLTYPEVLCPSGIELSRDGSLLILDTRKILRRAPDGRLDTVLEDDRIQYGVSDVDLLEGEDGAIYFPDLLGNRVWRLNSDGQVTLVAGTGDRGFSGDGGPATSAWLYRPNSLAFDRSGALLILDYGNHRVRRVDQGGSIQTFAGNGTYLFGSTGNPPGTPALAARMSVPNDLAVAPDGAVLVALSGRVEEIRTPMPQYGDVSHAVASRHGSELFTFDTSGRHTATVNALDGTILLRFLYDGRGLLTAVEDVLGRRTVVERTLDGEVEAIRSPWGQRTELTLDDDGYLAAVTDPTGAETRFEYGTGGLLVRRVRPGEQAHTYRYSALGRLLEDTDPAGGGKELDRRLITRGYQVDHTTRLGRTSTYGLEKLAGGSRLRTVTSSAGLTTTVLKTPDGTTVRSDPTGTTVTRTQGPDPRWGMLAPLSTRYEIALPSGNTFVSEHGRTVRLQDQNDPLRLRSLTDTWSKNGRSFTRTYENSTRTFTLVSPEGRHYATRVDELGRPVERIYGGYEPIRFGYDAEGRLAEIEEGPAGVGRLTRLSYDTGGFLAGVVDPAGRGTSLERDAVGRVARQVLPGGGVVAYDYDAEGRLTSIAPPGRPPHLFTYTDTGRPASYNPPSDPAVADETSYAYNLDHQLIRVTQPGGSSVELAYHAAGRLASVTIPEGSYGYTFDESTGHLSRMTAPGGSTVDFSYDGLVLTGTAWSGEVAGAVEVELDEDLRVAVRRVEGVPVGYQYDDDGLLVGAGELAVARDATTGQIAGTTLGAVTTARTYDGFGDIASFTAAVAGATVFETTLRRDDAGRIVEKSETIDGLTRTWAYDYDLDGRLASVSLDGSPHASYAYDANGNRIRYDGPYGFHEGTYDAGDRIETYAGSSYDVALDGALRRVSRSGQEIHYHHDALGHLRSVTLADGITIDYLLDPLNRRIGKKIDGVLVQGFLYEGRLQPVAELDGSGSVVSRFVYGTRSHVPDYMVRGGVSYRMVKDHLGSPRLVLDTTTGDIVQRMDYDAFGRTTLDTNPGFQPFGFAGGLYDRQTGLLHFGTREYDPHTGRWTTRDPLLFAGLDPNLYAYVGSDPVNYVDPSGWTKLPADPSDLPSDWARDPSHRDPSGQRFRNPNGDVLDFHKGRPDKPGWRGRDHWHHRPGGEGGDEHLLPGEEIPDSDPQTAPQGGPSEFCNVDDPAGTPVPYLVAAGIGAAIIVGTLVEDVLTGGVGILDDPVTLAAGAALILGTATFGGDDEPDSSGGDAGGNI